jgi:hypothetical protein
VSSVALTVFPSASILTLAEDITTENLKRNDEGVGGIVTYEENQSRT